MVREYACVVRGRVRCAVALRRQLRDGVAAPRFGLVYYAELLEARPLVFGGSGEGGEGGGSGEGGEGGDSFEHREQGCASDDRRDDGVGPPGLPYPVRVGVPCPRGAGAAVVAEEAAEAAEEAAEEAAAAMASVEAAVEEVEGAEGAEAAEVAEEEVLSLVRVAVGEGKHRMVRRMLAHCGLPVLNLKRQAYGACTLGGLQPGEARRATPAERRWARELLEATARADQCGLEQEGADDGVAEGTPGTGA